MPLGIATATVNIDLPNLTSATVSVYVTPDCGVETSNMWIVWGTPDQDEKDWTSQKMTTTDGKEFVATFNPNSYSYSYYLKTAEDMSDPATRYSYYWYNVTVAEHCNQIPYAGTNKQFSLSSWYNCADKYYHDYRVSNLQATAGTGYVNFSWDATDVEDSYTITLYDAYTDDHLTSFSVNGGATSYSWGVSTDLNGKDAVWTLTPSSPYPMDAVAGPATITLAASTVNLVSAKAETKDDKSIDISWEFNQTGLNCLVEIYSDGSGNLLRRAIVSGSNTYHYDALVNMDYNCYVQPLDASNNVLTPRFYAGQVTVGSLPEPITDLKGSADKRHLSFSWKTTAPHVKVWLYKNNSGSWRYVASEDLNTNSWSYDVDEDDQYQLYVSAYEESEPGKYVYAGYELDVVVNVFTASNLYSATVTVSEGGNIWPASPSGEYPEGFGLELSVWPDPDYVFVGWSDGVTSDSRTVYMTQDTVISANFVKLVNVTVSVNDPSFGTVDVSNYYTYSGNVYSFIPGTEVTLTAFPATDYRFVEWSDGVKTLNRVFTIDKDITLSATFEAAGTTPQHHLYVYGISGESSVTSIDADYYESDLITIAATAEAGYKFVKWSDDNIDNPRTITMGTADMTLYPVCELIKYTATISAGAGGKVDPSGDKTDLLYGTSLDIKAIPDAGYLFQNWSDGSVLDERTIIISQDTVLVANFKEDIPPVTYEFTVTAGEGGTVTQSKPNGSYEAGTTITLEAIPNKGYEFDKWSDENTSASRSITITDANITLKALFKEQSGTPSTYTLAISSAGGGKVNDEVNKTYESGEKVTIIATPDKDWTFDKWSDNNTEAVREITMYSDLTLIAYFKTTKKYEVTIKVDGDGGKVKPAYNKEKIQGGTELKIEAIPDEDYKFVEWSDGSTEAERTIIITQDTVLKATFAEISYYTLKVSIEPEDWGTVTFDGKNIASMKKTVEEGQSIKLNAEPNTGYEFAYYEESGKDDVTDAEYTVKMTKNRTITAVFKKKQQGLDELNAEGKVVKIVRDGQIYILRGDKVYTTQGQLVK